MGYCMYLEESDFFAAKENANEIITRMEDEGFSFESDSDGNLTEVEWSGEKLRNQYEAFCEIAPYVKTGSYIQMSGEDGCQWRWYFNDGTCEEHTGTLTWPSMNGYPLGTAADQK